MDDENNIDGDKVFQGKHNEVLKESSVEVSQSLEPMDTDAATNSNDKLEHKNEQMTTPANNSQLSISQQPVNVAALLAENLTSSSQGLTPAEQSPAPLNLTATPPGETIAPPGETIAPPEENIAPPKECSLLAEKSVTPAEESVTPAEKSVTPAEESVTPAEESPAVPPELVDIKIIYNKKKFDHSVDINKTILDLKADIEKLTGVPVATQKVIFKGSTQDHQTLKQLKVSKSANKFMVVGSTVNDLLKVTAPNLNTVDDSSSGKTAAATKEPFCKQTVHKKVLDKYGKPDEATAGIKGTTLPLPTTPISGMYVKSGGKARLTFKIDVDELWIGTKERTQKVKMASIKNVVSQPIEGHDGYHIMGFQMGTTESSNYWIYWVPAQYCEAIKNTVLGKWGEF